jgi:ADP-heptose:LPS heptosyltransferase
MIRQILFVELLGGIDDVLLALPAIHALGRSHPTAKLTVLTLAPGRDLLQHDPLIHQVIVAERGKARQAVEPLLIEQTFDLIISNTNCEDIAELITNTSAKQIVTNRWRSSKVNTGSPLSNNDEFVGDRFLKSLLAEGIITPDVSEFKPQLYLTATERQHVRRALGAVYQPLVVLCPDPGMPIKHWSIQNFTQVGQALQQHYGATVIVAVGSDDQQAETIVQAIGGSAQLWPQGSLRNLAAMLSWANLTIAADTGIARIAAALNVPTIPLFDPSWSGRYSQHPPHIKLQGHPNCPEQTIRHFTEQSCWYSDNGPFDWNMCVDDITPTQVLEAASQRLTHQPEPLVLPPVSLPHFPTYLTSPWRSIRNLLIMRLDNIGDVVMTTPTLRTLRENLPDTTITLMASPAGSLVAPLLPWIDDDVLTWRVLWQDLGRLDFQPEREWQLIDTLKQAQFDAAIVLTSFSQSPHPAGLICALADIPLRLGESKEQDGGTLTHAVLPAPDSIHQTERNLRLIEAVGFQVSDRRLTLQIPATPPTIAPPYILLSPWTSCQARNYDPERFAIAAHQLSEKTGWTVVVTGVDKDRPYAASVFDILGNCAIDLIGTTSLPELVSLIANAQLVLTNNTSTMHIADATQTPNIVLYSGTEQESQWQPRHSPSQLLRRPTLCSPCYAFTCPYDRQCLDILPETIVATALTLLNQIG